MTAQSLAAGALFALIAVAGAARGQIIASAGFNDVTGINGDGVANNSPYNVANASVIGQGAGEPGWFQPWQGGGTLAQVRNAGMAEGDGALFLQGTSQVFRTLTQPITRTSVEILLEIPFSAGAGGVNFYVNQNSIQDAGLRVGSQVVATADGRWQVLDGTGNGVGTLVNTGFFWTPGAYQRLRVDINMTTRTWEFYVNDVHFNAGHPLGFRGQPIFLDEVNFLNGNGAPNGTFIDAVRLFPAPVPEPSSLALLGIAACGGVPWMIRRVRRPGSQTRRSIGRCP